jgi:hypothetical protein
MKIGCKKLKAFVAMQIYIISNSKSKIVHLKRGWAIVHWFCSPYT